jgi:hypothetical protein
MMGPHFLSESTIGIIASESLLIHASYSHCRLWRGQGVCLDKFTAYVHLVQ